MNNSQNHAELKKECEFLQNRLDHMRMDIENLEKEPVKSYPIGFDPEGGYVVLFEEIEEDVKYSHHVYLAGNCDAEELRISCRDGRRFTTEPQATAAAAQKNAHTDLVKAIFENNQKYHDATDFPYVFYIDENHSVKGILTVKSNPIAIYGGSHGYDELFEKLTEKKIKIALGVV